MISRSLLAVACASVLVGVGGLFGCSQPTPGYECSSNSQCDNGPPGAQQGTCVGAYCAYPNAACGSGLRYDNAAGHGLANQCVPPVCGTTQGTAICGGGDGGVGTCADLQSDNQNCGACGTVCPRGMLCSKGACATQCGTGLTRCGTQCVDAATDGQNCGSCGNACGAGKACVKGACQIICPSGQTNCGGACVDTTVDGTNCGACGTACPGGQVCSASTCGTSCTTPTSLCPAVGPSPAYCANLQTDAANCDACGSQCPAGDTCSSGTCVATCPAGSSYCVPSGMLVGACVDLQTDDANCGGCGTACPAGQACAGGSCRCASGQTYCTSPAAGCFDLQNDAKSCGTCGNACPAGQMCSAGACAPSCAATYTACCPSGQIACTSSSGAAYCTPGAICPGTPSGTAPYCAITNGSDNANCGGCGIVCSGSGMSCQSGACACTAGLTSCGGACVNLQDDPKNCGACGMTCKGTEACSSGECQAIPASVTYESGFDHPTNVTFAFDTSGNVYLVWVDAGTYGLKNGTIWYQNIKSTTPSLFASGLDNPFAVVEGRDSLGNLVLYFTQAGDYRPPALADGAVAYSPFPAGGAATIVKPSAAIPWQITSDGTYVYWAEQGVGATGGSIVRYEMSNKSILTLAAGQNNPFWVAVGDGTNVVFTDAGTLLNGSVDYVPISGGGAPIAIATGLAGPRGVVVTGGFGAFSAVWVNRDGGTLQQTQYLPAIGSTATLATGQTNPTEVVADGSFVYWTNDAPNTSYPGGQVMKVPFDASTAPLEVANYQDHPYGLSLPGIFATTLLWTTNVNPGTIQAATK